MHMLDHEVPGLATKIEALPLEQRRRRLVRAAFAASRNIQDLEPPIQEILELAIRNNELLPERIAEAKAFAESADTRYFTEQEGGAAKGIWRNWFAKARLATAIANLFAGTSWQDAADAAYELCFTSDDKDAVVRLIESEIAASSMSEQDRS
jgi:hypothetical protein